MIKHIPVSGLVPGATYEITIRGKRVDGSYTEWYKTTDKWGNNSSEITHQITVDSSIPDGGSVMVIGRDGNISNDNKYYNVPGSIAVPVQLVSTNPTIPISTVGNFTSHGILNAQFSILSDPGYGSTTNRPMNGLAFSSNEFQSFYTSNSLADSSNLSFSGSRLYINRQGGDVTFGSTTNINTSIGFSDGNARTGRLAGYNGIFFIQAGVDANDATAELRITRTDQAATNLQNFNIYADRVNIVRSANTLSNSLGATNYTFAIGDITLNALRFDSNEIQASSNATTPTSLYLNFRGGDVYVGNAGNSVIVAGGSGQTPTYGLETPSIRSSGIIYGQGGLTITGATITCSSTYNNPALSGTTRTMLVNSSGVYGTGSSTRRVKSFIENINSQIESSSLLDLDIVKFKYNSDIEENGENAKYQLGFIAEQAEELGLEYLYQVDSEGLPDYFAYDKLPIYLLAFIKKQQKTINSLESRLAALENK